MATQADVRRIALSLPGAEEEPNHFAFGIRKKGKLKGFVWVWMERVNPKKPRVPQPKVLAIRVANLFDKDFLIRADPVKFFTEPHYDGFPAVLVRLAAVTAKELRPLITEAWRCQAPKEPEPKARKGAGRRAALVLALGLVGRPLHSQAPHTLRPPDARLASEFSRIVGVRELSDGKLLIADAGDKRVVVADLAKGAVTQIGREGKGPGEYASVTWLYATAADSTLMADPMSGRWLFFQADRVARTTAADDPVVLATRGSLRGADARGHILATTAPGVRGGTQTFGKGDSISTLLVTVASGAGDTVARLRIPPFTLQAVLDKSDKPISINIRNPPLSSGEEPILFPDGWLAVARLDPYRVDWRSPEGRWIRGAPLPYVEQPVDAREREAYLARRAQTTGTQPPTIRDEEWPRTVPPFLTRPLIPAPDGTLWILRTQTAAHPGNRYDHVDRAGRLVGWLELAPSERLAGQGAGGLYVIVTDDDGIQRLERHPWP